MPLIIAFNRLQKKTHTFAIAGSQMVQHCINDESLFNREWQNSIYTAQSKSLNWFQYFFHSWLRPGTSATNLMTRRMAIANWTCVSWVAYAPATIAVNVTWIDREFNACQTPRSMYPSIFNHFWDIAVYRWRVTGFQQCSWANERF